MASQLTRRQERFCIEWFKTKGVARHAYLNAGYAVTAPHVADVCASRRLPHARVRARLRALHARVLPKATDIPADSIANELEEARPGATSQAQGAAMVSASVSKAKLVGLMIDRKEIGDAGEFQRMTEQELRDYIANGDNVPVNTAQSAPAPTHPAPKQEQ